MAQTVTIEVDWTSKSGAADATIAFGETFNVSITGMSNVTGHLRLVLLSQSVSSEEAVLWSKEYPVPTQEGGVVEIESVRIFTENVYETLKAQGGKAKLYLSVLNVRGEETVTGDDGETNQVAITTDYGIARITLTLGSYLEDGPIPEDFDPDTMTVGELQVFLSQIQEELASKADQIIFPCGVSIGSDEEKGATNDGSQINIGQGSLAKGSGSIAIGKDAKAYAGGNVIIGQESHNISGGFACNVLVGPKNTSTNATYGIAIGAGLSITEHGEIAIGVGDDETAQGNVDVANAAKKNTIRVKGGVLTVGGKKIGGDSDITVDPSLSTSSTNPVQNKVITNALNQKLTWSSLSSYIRAEDSPDVYEALGSEYQARDAAAFMSQRGYDGKFRGFGLKDGSIRWIDNSGTVHTESLGGGNTEVWNGTIDSIDGVTDDMIGAKPLSNGNYPRLHARNKEIHGCKGFSNETGDYTGQELLLPWEVAMTNESSYLMAAVKFQANRGFGTQTFVQPLVPKETGSAQAYGFTHALPAFEDSPVYWKGHFIYSNARQMHLPWDKITTGGQGTLALTSDIPDASGFVENSGTKTDPTISGANVTIQSTTSSGLIASAGKVSGIVVNPIALLVFNQGAFTTFTYENLIAGIKGGLVANNGCCFTPKSNANNSLAFKVDRTKTLYTANITTDALETTLSVSDTNDVIADGETCVIWLHITVASTITTAPQITVPDTIQFLDNGPSFAAGSECMLALMSTDGGATWQANLQWEKAVTA